MSRLSLRARITVLFVGTVFSVGLLLIGLVYAHLRFTPVPFQATFPIDSPDQEGLVIDAAVPITQEILRVVLVASLTVLAALTALAGAVGWFVAGLVIRPLTGIADTARQVTAGDLTTRVAYSGPRDEVADVTDALNVMLDSVQRAVDKQKRFAANASHELKTPIATIQAIADVALDDPDPATMRTSLQRIREVNSANAATVEALLQLARLNPKRRRIDVGEVCAQVAGQRGIPLEAEPLLIDASPNLIHQAIDNLARNAVSHGAPGTAAMRAYVDASVDAGGASGARAVVEVTNAGPASGARGHGIGLELTREIAQAHGGELELEPLPDGGMRAEIRLPIPYIMRA